MVTTGFDGTVRKWDLKNMQMDSLFEDRNATGKDVIIQAITWCKIQPPKGQPADAYSNLVVIGTADGKVKLIDLARNKILSQFKSEGNSEATVFSLDWNKDGFLAIGTTDYVIHIKKFDPELNTFAKHTKVATNCECRCVSFSTLKPNLLGIGLFNGSLVIFDIEKDEVAQVIKVSNSRILCVEWHPQFEYILATGSFDHIVRIHDTKYVSYSCVLCLRLIVFLSNRVE